MLALAPGLSAQFEERLRNKEIPERSHGFYRKWLRYYLDFCRKYGFPDASKESLPHFIEKLQEKGQNKELPWSDPNQLPQYSLAPHPARWVRRGASDPSRSSAVFTGSNC